MPNSGLANLGNTCYMNSCLQVLVNTYELSNFLSTNKYKKKLNKIPDGILLVKYDNLREEMCKGNTDVVVPKEFLRTMQYVAHGKKLDNFMGFQQNDVPEFLIFLIDCFHNAISRKVDMEITGKIINEKDKIAVKCFEVIKEMYSNEYSEIWNLFYGIHVSEIHCLKTNTIISFKPEPFFMIDLPIPDEIKEPTLIDCFELYVKGEILDKDNQVFNETINEKVDANKRISFWSLPNILVIDLKRFDYRNHKNQKLVTFPLENLDLSKYIVGYNKDSFIYDLYGVCNHSGSSMGGHYTACIKDQENKWYHCNDTIVSEISSSNVSQIINPKAYCLFYRKKKN
jgi:ubiquitin C-terminal hydrolase